MIRIPDNKCSHINFIGFGPSFICYGGQWIDSKKGARWFGINKGKGTRLNKHK